MEEKIVTTFGEKYGNPQTLADSFDFIENFLKINVLNWSPSPDTSQIVDKFSDLISNMSDNDFVFLLIHSGYIPEHYEHDSSQETLYSKLIECLVCEWAKRIGFTNSYLQTQKSSKEDITIVWNEQVIVSDAKSFRLGRSQAAPNVKDTIKKADYKKWLENYNPQNRVGGLLTFPSLHNWAKQTDVYSYTSDKTEPILFIFYQHLAFILYSGIKSENIVKSIEEYPLIHPTTTKSPIEYFTRQLPSLFGEKFNEWISFSELSDYIIKAKVIHTITSIESQIEKTRRRIYLDIEQIRDLEVFRERLMSSELRVHAGQLIKNLDNIKKFRVPKPVKEKSNKKI
jgi:hypothetical protein